jgi:superfamily II DNA or RNA helicase
MELRNFQKEIIAEIERHLSDEALHIVAPPGAGKTLLGVEIAKKLQKRTLILVPSLVLKNQWLSYLTAAFGSQNVSQDFIEPKSITLTTYQKFHLQHQAIVNNFYEFLILDEAHHLKKLWAEELISFKKRQTIQSLSLTATPPYDAASNEWKRYIDLNGAIDIEIPATQLIKEEILTPYQDYVYLVPESKENEQAFAAFLQTQNEIVAMLVHDEEVAAFLLKLAFIAAPLENVDYIYANFELYLSILLYLYAQDWELGNAHWEVLGLKKYKNKIRLPSPTKEQLILLYQFLFEQNPSLYIFDYLKQMKWLYREKLALFPAYKNSNNYRTIPLKKEAIAKIVLKEEAFLGKELCAVIFMDRIKQDTLFGQDPYLEFGVAPLFLFLKELIQATTNLAAICGKFCLLQADLAEQLFPMLKSTPLEGEGSYVFLSLTDENRDQILTEVTRALNQKRINLLIGTISFLGEGWDCASINTIILANTSSSYVQTQQLRGRGLRQAPGKCFTNIWHIAAVYKTIEVKEQVEFQAIVKRLSFIAGLNCLAHDSRISTGIERFDLPLSMTEDALNRYNFDNFFHAQRRELLQKKWMEAITKGTHQSMPLLMRPAQKQSALTNDFLKKQALRKTNFYANIFAISFFRNLRSRFSWRNYCKQLELLVTTIFDLLQEDGVLSKENRLKLEKTENSFLCELENSPFNVNTFFNQQIAEIMHEIDTPRYLLRLNRIYFSVPSYFSKNKKDVLRLVNVLKGRTKKATTYYTKNVEGRKALMEAYIQQTSREVIEEKIWS